MQLSVTDTTEPVAEAQPRISPATLLGDAVRGSDRGLMAEAKLTVMVVTPVPPFWALLKSAKDSGLAVMTDVPAATPVAMPVEEMVATEGVALNQVAGEPPLARLNVEPSDIRKVALKVWVLPEVILGLAGLRRRLAMVSPPGFAPVPERLMT